MATDTTHNSEGNQNMSKTYTNGYFRKVAKQHKVPWLRIKHMADAPPHFHPRRTIIAPPRQPEAFHSFTQRPLLPIYPISNGIYPLIRRVGQIFYYMLTAFDRLIIFNKISFNWDSLAISFL